MNQYAAMAERHWRRWLPSRVAAMDDPSSFFSNLGEEAAAQIEDLTADLAGDDPPGETFIGEGGPAEHGPAASRGDHAAGDGAAPARAGSGGGRRLGAGDQPPLAAADGAAQPARFRPTGQEDLAPSGSVSRVPANVEAISTLHAIEREERDATPDEQAVLARWSGWGAVPETFDPSREDLARARRDLGAMLSEQELAAAARNTLNAHYTDAELVKVIWDADGQLGFTEGRVLELGCGSGNFIGFAPEGAQMLGVELEPVTAAIARALYPDAHVLTRASRTFACGRGPSTWSWATSPSARWR